MRFNNHFHVAKSKNQCVSLHVPDALSSFGFPPTSLDSNPSQSPILGALLMLEYSKSQSSVYMKAQWLEWKNDLNNQNDQWLLHILQQPTSVIQATSFWSMRICYVFSFLRLISQASLAPNRPPIPLSGVGAAGQCLPHTAGPAKGVPIGTCQLNLTHAQIHVPGL